MTPLICLVVFTSNILGSFNDPFEFDGNYGDEANPIREYVFEQVVSRESLVNNLTEFQIVQLMTSENPSIEESQQYSQQLVLEAIQKDLQHGPTLNELISPALIEQLLQKQQELQVDSFSEADFTDILYFIDRYRDQKVFSFFRHHPSDLLSLDKILRDKATREGRNFDLPILSSTEPLKGESAFKLKSHLLETLFTKELFRDHLQSLGLVATNVGPTTVKKRMVTAQHSKAGRFAVDEEDYVIILKPENGGLYQMTNPTVGFQEEKPDPTIALPNIENPSDHYPVGITLLRTP